MFGISTAWGWHRTLGVVTEAVALAAAVVAIVVRRVGVRWLTAGIFILIAFQHGTASIGGLAGAVHAMNALLMLAMALTVLRRVRGGAPVPAAPHLATV